VAPNVPIACRSNLLVPYQQRAHISVLQTRPSHVEKYLAKEEQFPEGIETGRIWGVWNKKFLPIQWETVKVTLKDAFAIRRIYRKLARRKSSGSLRRMTVFVRYENVLRLLKFLGYQVE
jgi:hypothetical protein